MSKALQCSSLRPRNGPPGQWVRQVLLLIRMWDRSLPGRSVRRASCWCTAIGELHSVIAQERETVCMCGAGVKSAQTPVCLCACEAHTPPHLGSIRSLVQRPAPS